jgi:nitric oxide reductase subunit B
MSYKRLWIALALVLIISFAVLGGVGVKILNEAPPIPSAVVTSDGRLLFDGSFIRDGQTPGNPVFAVGAVVLG